MKIKISRKMKKSVYKTGSLLCISLFLISFTLNAQNELTKEYHKEYSATKGMKLELNNRYGAIVVHTSDNDQVVIDIKVTLKFPNRDRAERLISYIDVQFSEGSDGISVKTVIDDNFNFTGWGGDSRRFSIDYDVLMPEWMDLELVNRYGKTDLDNLSGHVSLDVRYGNITANVLARGNEKPMNSVTISYGNCSIEEAGWLDATIRYSGNFSVTRSQALLIDSKYSKLRLGSVSSLVGEVKYDNLRINEISNLVLDAGYTDVNIGTLSKKLVFEGGYGGFNADIIPAGFESLEIDTRYTGVRLGIAENASYILDAETSYCSLKYDEEKLKVRRRIVENTSSEISGIVGSDDSPDSSVKVKTSYGSVKLF